jgi:hypothetical protein
LTTIQQILNELWWKVLKILDILTLSQIIVFSCFWPCPTSVRSFQLIELMNVGLFNAFDIGLTTIQQILNELWYKVLKILYILPMSQINVLSCFWQGTTRVRCFQLIERINIVLLNAFDICLTAIQQILNVLWWKVLKILYSVTNRGIFMFSTMYCKCHAFSND